MNHIYKVIWSKVKGCYVVVSEITLNHDKSARRVRNAAASALLAVAALTGSLTFGVPDYAGAVEPTAGVTDEKQYVAYAGSRLTPGYHFDPDSGYSIRNGYILVIKENGGKTTPLAGTAKTIDVVWTGEYEGEKITKPTEIIETVTTKPGPSGTVTNLNQSLNKATPSGYSGVSNSTGTEVGKNWNYIIEDTDGTWTKSNKIAAGHKAGGYVDLQGSNSPHGFVTTQTAGGKLKWDDASQMYTYNGQEVSLNNIYVIDGKIGVFTNADGSKVYTGTVYGKNNEILMTSKDEKDNKYYSYWATKVSDTTLTMGTYSIKNYDTDMHMLVDNDAKLHNEAIKRVKAETSANETAGTKDMTLSLIRNGIDGVETPVDGTVTITGGGGKNVDGKKAEDTFITITHKTPVKDEDGNPVLDKNGNAEFTEVTQTFNTGSIVSGVSKDGDWVGLTINGIEHRVRDVHILPNGHLEKDDENDPKWVKDGDGAYTVNDDGTVSLQVWNGKNVNGEGNKTDAIVIKDVASREYVNDLAVKYKHSTDDKGNITVDKSAIPLEGKEYNKADLATGTKITNVAYAKDDEGDAAVNVDKLKDYVSQNGGGSWNLTTNNDEANKASIGKDDTVDLSGAFDGTKLDEKGNAVSQDNDKSEHQNISVAKDDVTDKDGNVTGTNVSFQLNDVLHVGTSDGSKTVTIDGTKGEITGLTNQTWQPYDYSKKNTYVDDHGLTQPVNQYADSGKAVSEAQLRDALENLPEQIQMTEGGKGHWYTYDPKKGFVQFDLTPQTAKIEGFSLQSIAMGNGAVIYGNSLGHTADGENSSDNIAIGANTQISQAITDKDTDNDTRAEGNIVIGSYATAVGVNQGNIHWNGTSYNEKQDYNIDEATVLGFDAHVESSYSTALGAHSLVQSSDLLTKANDDADPDSDMGVISVGNSRGFDRLPDHTRHNHTGDYTRRIINVSKGQINQESTDAINGSQLYRAYASSIHYDSSNGGQGVLPTDPKNINYNKIILAGETYNPATGKGGTVIKNLGPGHDGSDAVNVDQLKQVEAGDMSLHNGRDSISAVTVTEKRDGKESTTQLNQGYKVKEDGTVIMQVEDNKTVGGNVSNVVIANVASKAQQDENTGKINELDDFAVKYDKTDGKVNKGSVTLDSPTAYKKDVENSGTKITNVAYAKDDDGGAAVNVDKLKDYVDKNGGGSWNLTTNGDADHKATINKDNTVDFSGDGSINVTKENGTNGGANVKLSLSNHIVVGTPGKDGEKGEAGSIGLVGPTGPAGADGKDGLSTTIIKTGKDGKDGITRIIYTDKDDPTHTEHKVATLDDGLKFKGDTGTAQSVALNKQVNIIGGQTEQSKLSDGANIGVVTGEFNKKTGSLDLTVKLAKDLTDLNSVTIGGTKDEHDKVTGAVIINNDGINAGGKKITNVADGTISADSKDAINGSQLNDYVDAQKKGGFGITAEDKNSVKKNLGDTVELVGDGKNIKTSVKDGKVQVALNDDITLGEGTEAIHINGTKVSINMGSITVDGKTGTVSGLTNKTIDYEGFATAGRAATEEQLKLVADMADKAQSSHTVLTAENKKAEKDGKYSEGNIQLSETTLENGAAKYDVKLNDVITLGQEKNKQVTINGLDGLIAIGQDGLKLGWQYYDNGNKLEKEEGYFLTGLNNTTFYTDKDHYQAYKDSNRAATEGQLYSAFDFLNQKIDGITINGTTGKNPSGDSGSTGGSGSEGGSTGGTTGGSGSISGSGNIVVTPKPSTDPNKPDSPGWNLDLNNEKVHLGNDKNSVDIQGNSGNVTATNSFTVNENGTTSSLTSNSLEVGGSTYISKYGINANKKKVTQVADGDVSEKSTDAVNGSQLYATNQAVSNNTTNIQNLAGSVNKLGNRVNRVGAGAAALAALHPLDFDPDDKWDFSAGYGNYAGANAVAVGAYYRPNEDTMFSVGGSMGGGENMVNAGISVKLGQGNHVSTSRVAMAKEIKDLRAVVVMQGKQIQDLVSIVNQLTGAKLYEKNVADVPFPDVPENHWAYEYVHDLVKQGIIEGYPDGMYGGDRSMTRYEMAAFIWRLLQRGVNVPDKLQAEFHMELERFRVDTVAKDKDGRPTIERVRVNKVQ